jgi:hypothetical protein
VGNNPTACFCFVMRIYNGFLILLVSALLWLLPVSEAIYNFRTDIRDDSSTVATDPAETTKDIQLFKPLYENDTSRVTFTSTLLTDSVAVATYAPTTRILSITGLTDDTARTLEIEYPYNALATNTAINTLMNVLPFFWTLILIALPVVAIVVIYQGRA